MVEKSHPVWLCVYLCMHLARAWSKSLTNERHVLSRSHPLCTPSVRSARQVRSSLLMGCLVLHPGPQVHCRHAEGQKGRCGAIPGQAGLLQSGAHRPGDHVCHHKHSWTQDLEEHDCWSHAWQNRCAMEGRFHRRGPARYVFTPVRPHRICGKEPHTTPETPDQPHSKA